MSLCQCLTQKFLALFQQLNPESLTLLLLLFLDLRLETASHQRLQRAACRPSFPL
jgi:hypothetical protein